MAGSNRPPRGQPVGAARSEHRPDIDGLRALAVLPVVAYHARIGAIPGGFIGVDVFFVISGYLITQVLLKDIERERFSLLNFYERRVRRIAPALFGVLIGTFIVCLRYSLPSELADYSKSLVAATLSASNFYFWRTADYFSAPAVTQPLLHTWSLAVEEQFYLLWPLCLLFAYRLFRSRLLLATLLVVVVSFALSVVGAFRDPAATFYLAHTRAWELLLGALLAIGMFPRPLGRLARNALALIGVALIVGSVLLIRNYMPFPGLLAAPACIGTFCVILAGRDGPSGMGSLLSWRPVAFIGLISYSLYLWHWPLVVFQRDYGLLLIPGAPDRDQKLLVIGCSLVLGALSWRFIEQPFRAGAWRPSRQTLFRITGTAAAISLACGTVAWVAAGFPSRYSPAQLRIASYLTYGQKGSIKADPCFLDGRSGATSFPSECLTGDPHKRNFLLLGDSHAGELWFGLHSEFADIHFMQATASDCFPVLQHGWQEAPFCMQAMDGVLHDYLTAHHVDRVIVAARWKAAYLPRIAATLAWLHERGIPVTLVGPTLVFDLPLPRLILTAERNGDPSLPAQNWDHSLLTLDRDMKAVAAANGADYLSILELFCPAGRCELQDARGMPLIFDQEHFTAEGSIMVASALRQSRVWSQTTTARTSAVSP